MVESVVGERAIRASGVLPFKEFVEEILDVDLFDDNVSGSIGAQSVSEVYEFEDGPVGCWSTAERSMRLYCSIVEAGEE